MYGGQGSNPTFDAMARNARKPNYGRKKKGQLKADKKTPLGLLRNSIRANEDSLYRLQAQWYEQVLFTHGLQHLHFHMGLGRTVTPESDSNRVRITYNQVLPIIEGQKSLLLSREPSREVYPITDDESSLLAIEQGNDLLRWADEKHGTEEVAMEAAAFLAETGNAFIHPGWDPQGGRMFQSDSGEVFYEGDPTLECVSPFQMGFHPHASKFENSPWCTRQSLMPREWLEAIDPEAAMKLGSDGTTGEHGAFYEQELLNPVQGYRSGSSHIPDGKDFFKLTQMWHVPCPEYPDGLYVVAAGNGPYPDILIHQGPNPYQSLPFVHFRLLDIPGNGWGECFVKHLIPPQRALNRFVGQSIETGNRVSNPILFIPNSIPQELITNEPGSIVRYPDHLTQPGYFLRPPDLPSYIFEAKAAAIQYMDAVTSPVGPLADEQASRATSGVQLSLQQELRERRVAPMVRRWELSWQKVWRKYMENWARFQKIPRSIGIARDDGSWKAVEFNSAMLDGRIQVRIVKHSALPNSRTATFAEWIELVKSGAADVLNDPELKRQMFDDIGKGHMIRSWGKFTADMDKARRNLAAIRNGQMAVGPDLMDDADAHLSVYITWMKTEEYEGWRKSGVVIESEYGPIQADQHLREIVMAFQELKNRALQQQMMMSQMGCEGGGGMPYQQGAHGASGTIPGASSSAPGSPQGGAMPNQSQGFGKAPNPMGNDGRPSPDAGLY